MISVRLDPANGVRAIIVRPRDAREPHILALTSVGLRPLLQLGPTDVLGLKLGPLLQLQRRGEGGDLRPFVLEDDDDEFRRATCDPATGMVYLCSKSVILQLDVEDSNTVSVLAGEQGHEDDRDGPGQDARVDRPFCIIADGHGSLLFKDCGSAHVRRVVLPPPGSPPNTPSPAVSTLPFEYASNIWGMALDYAEPQRMYVATETAIYRHDRLPYDPSTTTAGANSSNDSDAAVANRAPRSRANKPVLLAGCEGVEEYVDGFTACDDDGSGAPAPSTARFRHITSTLVDSHGRLLVAECVNEEAACVRVVSPCGLVSTLVASLDIAGTEFCLSVLPHGWLAVFNWSDSHIHMLHLGSRMAPSAPAPRPPSAAADASFGGGGADARPGRPGLAGLAADLDVLLDAPPEVAAADVEVLVGGESFPCHRVVLAARCEYFRGRFGSGLADSADGQISLPHADPAAFALLRRYLYTSALAIPPHLLRPTLELADRLLLPAAAEAASQQLLDAVSPGSVVADLLWAENRCLPDLLAGLKAYYLDNAHRVLEEAPDSLEQLMRESPQLHLELYAAGIKRARRR